MVIETHPASINAGSGLRSQLAKKPASPAISGARCLLIRSASFTDGGLSRSCSKRLVEVAEGDEAEEPDRRRDAQSTTTPAEANTLATASKPVSMREPPLNLAALFFD
jgi:hypothetical protein